MFPLPLSLFFTHTYGSSLGEKGKERSSVGAVLGIFLGLMSGGFAE
jgi:hypothetical protein